MKGHVTTPAGAVVIVAVEMAAKVIVGALALVLVESLALVDAKATVGDRQAINSYRYEAKRRNARTSFKTRILQKRLKTCSSHHGTFISLSYSSYRTYY